MLLHNLTGRTLSLKAKWFYGQNKAQHRSEETQRSRQIRSVTQKHPARPQVGSVLRLHDMWRGIMRSCDCSWRRSTAGSFLSVWTWERSSLRSTRSLTTPRELLSPHDSSLSPHMQTHTHACNTNSSQHTALLLKTILYMWWLHECASVSPGEDICDRSSWCFVGSVAVVVFHRHSHGCPLETGLYDGC